MRGLSSQDLEQLAGEIRDLIVESVGVHGGHLGSNLGVVELTLAIHRVFESPNDIVLWDTGHQAYVHKIVTGRRAAFTTLRQAGGLSGYPSRAESDHDWVENSHASTILSYAHGLATALAVQHHDGRRIVAVLGDGALTGGMTYEALNNLGHSQRKVVVVLNDNGRSYAPTVGVLARLTRLRANATYVRSRARVQRVLREMPMIGEYLDLGVEGVRAAAREAVLSPSSSAEALGDGAPIPEAVLHPGDFFEALGIHYVGPVDGHDMPGLERVLHLAAEHDGPVVVHALTQKGRGYGPAEGDGEKCLHDAPVFDPVAGPPPWCPTGYTKVFADAMVKIGELDPRVVAITAAMAGPTGLRPFQERWPDRVVDVGIAEQHAVTAAAGLAILGLRPVVAIYSTFLTRALDQVNLDVGLHRLPVVFCIDRAGITGDDGPSHHGVLDMALLSQVPGMTVLAPSSAEELRGMLGHALTLDGPVAIRYPKGAAKAAAPGGVGMGVRARLVREGSDVCILAVGKLVEAAMTAADRLATQGVSPTVWDMRAVKPLDAAMVASAAGHRLVVTAEDGVRRGGAGAAVAAALAESGGLVPPLLTLGVPDAYIPQGRVETILSELGLDADHIVATVLTALGAERLVVRPRPAPEDGPASVHGSSRERTGRGDRRPMDPLIVRIGGNGSAATPLLRSVAHTAPGVLHLAVSLQVVDRTRGGWFLQRRAASKAVFPGCWANTCCTHPAPGEDPASAAMRRLREETGLIVDDIIAAGSFTYRATDASSGLVEHEHDYVFVAFADTAAAQPDPQEIGEIAILPFTDALDLVQSGAGAPWAPEVLRRSFAVLNRSSSAKGA